MVNGVSEGTKRAKFSAVDQALILATLAALTSSEKSSLRKLLDREMNWSEFREKVFHNDVASMVYLTLTRNGLFQQIPVAIQTEIQSRYETIRARNTARWHLGQELFTRLRGAGVEIIVLKGGLFAERVYGDVGYKKMNDIDLLVKFSDLETLQKIYKEMGLVPLALLEGGGDPCEAKGYHLPAYVSRDLSFVLGTHWNLCNPKHGYLFDRDQLWKNARPVKFGTADVWSLSPTDVLHHLIVHFHYYKTGLKELADFANWLRIHPDFDWDAFMKEVEIAGSWTPAFRTLKLVKTLYGAGIPESFLERCREKADAWVARDTCRMAFRKDLLLLSRSVYNSEIEKGYLAFTFEHDFVRKWPWFLTFWKRLLFPPLAVLLRTNACACCERNVLWLWVMNLFRTSKEVGKSYGMAIFFLLMLKSGAELLGSLFGMGPDKMASLRQELGADDQRIRELLDSMD
ncbi:MAG: nucleotidyltransferase family protein [Candidatus Ozemobacteraceae bacterium]